MSKSIGPARAHRVQVSADRDGQRLDNFLIARLKGLPRAAIYRMIRTGQVRVNGGRARPSKRLCEGDEVRIPPVRVSEGGQAPVSERVLRQISDAIVHEDRDLMVIDKPSGVAVHPGSGLAWGLIDVVRQLRPGEYVELAHRLDRETSGCVVLARNGPALKHLSALFRSGAVSKQYLCLLDGVMQQSLIEVDEPVSRVRGDGESRIETGSGGKAAQTRFSLLQAYRDCSYARAELLTGRTHQIRVHALHIGMPLAGDGKYASEKAVAKWRRRGLNRLFLHAHRLEFESPGGEMMTFSAPLPPRLRQVLDEL